MIDSTKGYATKLRRLSLITQKLESKENHKNIADRKLSRIFAALRLKTFCFNDGRIKLIIDSPITQNWIKNNTFSIINLHGLHPLFGMSNLDSAQCLDFAMCKRNNFTHKNLTNSSKFIMLLGK